jgi:hypothetical protein
MIEGKISTSAVKAEVCDSIVDIVESGIAAIEAAYREGYIAGLEYENSAVTMARHWPASDAFWDIKAMRKIAQGIRNESENP